LFDNQSYFGSKVQFSEAIDVPARMMLFDPQTSGGLLLGVPEERLAAFTKRADEAGQPIWKIGKVREGKGIRVK
jgi:selenide,water dikinase